ncbi:hypothetical protein ONR75_18550 [Rhodopseudomonas sp. P2A-2r]|nr:hypothetical protein [Rhodopseudomonas sp. P2A-2r]UZE47005.1 hypothetical protein ONR75_18550 [Rhodopseudomonas sp. P2A-2r]
MGRYRKLGELHPSEIIFAIFSDIMKAPTITIWQNGEVELH